MNEYFISNCLAAQWHSKLHNCQGVWFFSGSGNKDLSISYLKNAMIICIHLSCTLHGANMFVPLRSSVSRSALWSHLTHQKQLTRWIFVELAVGNWQLY